MNARVPVVAAAVALIVVGCLNMLTATIMSGTPNHRRWNHALLASGVITTGIGAVALLTLFLLVLLTELEDK